MYTKVTYDLGEVKEIQKYIPGNYGAPGCPRERKRKRTPEEIKRQNERNKRRKVQRLIMANFGEGDLHVTLTYAKDKYVLAFTAAVFCYSIQATVNIEQPITTPLFIVFVSLCEAMARQRDVASTPPF